MTLNWKNISALLVSILALQAHTVKGQTESERKFGPWVWGLASGVVHQFDTDLEDTEGEFSVTRAFIQPSLGYAWDRRNSASLSLGYGSVDYDFSSQANIGGREPWGKIRDQRVSVPIRFSAGDRADVIVIPSVRSYAESGADLSDGRTEGALAALSWKVSDSLSIGPGFGWFTELVGGSNAFPILVIDWDITEQLSLTTGRGVAASQGPGLTLNYQFADHWKVALTGRSEKIRFALKDDGLNNDRFGEDRSLPLLLAIEYSPWPMTSVNAFFGAEFAGSLRIEDSEGDTLARNDFKTAPVMGFTFSSRF